MSSKYGGTALFGNLFGTKFKKKFENNKLAA
jgi:hypothetical protein